MPPERSTPGTVFRRPEGHYIRTMDTFELDRAEDVEYDMDDQDYAWLELVNKKRKEEGHTAVSYDDMEFVIDLLEKLWFDLTKDIVKADPTAVAAGDDVPCDVCNDAECDNTNAIVFCDGCNLAVHQDCYGIPYIPEGQWLCRRCMLSPSHQVSCIFCPNPGGAFKQTTTNKWAHLLCALWIPEVSIQNHVYMEPIEVSTRIPKSRWKLVCNICKIRKGACIQCHKTSCFTAFHVTCARRAGLSMTNRTLDPHLIHVYCQRHSIPERIVDKRREREDSQGFPMDVDEYSPEEDGSPEIDIDGDGFPNPGTPHKASSSSTGDGEGILVSTSATATPSSTPSPAPRLHYRPYIELKPVAPVFIAKQLAEAMTSHPMKAKAQFLHLAIRYWALKREACRGAPLLKRLHLEPWTAFQDSADTEAEKVKRFQMVRLLRSDFEKVRMLTELVRKRERFKLKAYESYRDALRLALCPLSFYASQIVRKMQSADSKKYFHEPVPVEDVPDYYDVIKEPMDLATLEARIPSYDSLDAFIHDASLIVRNAMTYNKPKTPYYRSAERIAASLRTWEAVARDGLARLDRQICTVEDGPLLRLFHTGPDPEELEAERQRREAERLAEEEERKRVEEEERKAQEAEEAEKARIEVERLEDQRIEEARIRAREAARARQKAREQEAREKRERGRIRDREKRLQRKAEAAAQAAADLLNPRTRPPSPLEVPLPSRQSSRILSLSGQGHPEASPSSAPPTLKTLTDHEEGTRSSPRKLKAAISSTSPHTPSNPVANRPAPRLIQTRLIPRSRRSPSDPGSFVWARVAGYAFFPAKVYNPTSREVPRGIGREANPSAPILVRFFDDGDKQWGWCKKESLEPFAEDMALDMRMLHQTSRRKGVSSRRLARNLRDTFRRACEARGIKWSKYIPPEEGAEA